jgi:hypothetical protein
MGDKPRTILTHLSLLAILLLAIVPTAGRMAGGSHAMHAASVMADPPASHGAHHAMGHHGAGHHAPPAPPAQAPSAPPDGDCEYCPLLAGLVAFALPPLALDAIDAPTRVPPVRAFAPRTLLVPGLGARGPPTSDA